jgi:hypothetical protein
MSHTLRDARQEMYNEQPSWAICPITYYNGFCVDSRKKGVKIVVRVRKENASRKRYARRVETGPVDRSKTILPTSHVVTKFIPRKHGCFPSFHPRLPF